MADDVAGRNVDLQFDTVARNEATAGAFTCRMCQRTIHSEYYDVSGSPTCADCRTHVETLIETPTGAGPLLKAGVFGLVAGIAGAIIYYAVIAITNFEIGIVAILIGYMVGYAVRKGAGGRGGRRFQVLAVALTYSAVAFAYAPVVIQAMLKKDAKVSASSSAPATATTSNPATRRPGDAPVSRPGLLKALAFLAAFIAALPVLVIVSSFPTGLISAAIIFFGMKQAWRMTGAAPLQISGPYRVGAPPAASV